MYCLRRLRARVKKSNSSNKMFTPEPLKTLVFNVSRTEGNNLLHQLVLDCSHPNNSYGINYIHAILMSGLPVNALNEEGYSALCLAVRKNNLLMVQKLLSCLVNIDVSAQCRDFDRNTVLHFAAELGNLSIIEELLNKRADVNIINSSDATALCFAARSGNLDVLKLLVNNGADVNITGFHGGPLHYAFDSHNFEAVEFLISRGADLLSTDINDDTILHNAAKRGDFAMVRLLVENGADVNARNESGYTPLNFAAASDNFEAVQFLISRGAEFRAINEHCSTCLHFAAESNNLNIVEFFLSNGMHVNAKNHNNNTPLHQAVRSGSLDIVEYLIINNADVNAEGWFKRTPLFVAVIAGRLEVVKLLVGNGADLHIEDERRKIPIHEAIIRDHSEIGAFLLEQGQNLDSLYDGETLLHFAVMKGSIKFTKMLLEKCANVDATGRYSRTPLHHLLYSLLLPTAKYDNLNVEGNKSTLLKIALLLEGNADVNIEDNCGKTPLWLARRLGFNDIIKLFSEKCN